MRRLRTSVRRRLPDVNYYVLTVDSGGAYGVDVDADTVVVVVDDPAARTGGAVTRRTT
ncbi:hypothetical protein HQQ80_19530 [Microbacteriaceae bacterium VKM Ac-2855]|nr:hypothetical protein [Microbacteriaceae bacterium VKM Ac-2855]